MYSTADIRRLLSAVANPIKEGSEFRLSDGSRPISPRKILQIYLDALLGMMFDFMSNPEDDGLLLVTFRRTVENFMRIHCFSGVEHVDIMVAFENLDRFQRLTENKANTPEDATLYEEFCDGLPPQILAYLQFTLSVMVPDLMERSITNSLGSFLMGLMTQSLIGENGVKLEGIEEALLRMILERAVRKISSINVSDCFDLDSLIVAMHRRAGVRVEGVLRSWTFVVEVLRHVFLRPPMASSQATCALLRDIRTRVQAMQGINSFCAVIAPSARFLDDRRVAEILLRASMTPDMRRMVLAMHSLVSDTNTRSLQDIVRRNCDRRDDLRRQTDAAEQKALARQMEATRQGANLDEYQRLLDEARLSNHEHNGTTHLDLMRQIVGIIQSGNVSAIKSLLYGAGKHAHLPIIGLSRMIQSLFDGSRTRGRSPIIGIRRMIQSLFDGSRTRGRSPIIGVRRLILLVRTLAPDETLHELGMSRASRHEFPTENIRNRTNLMIRDILASGGGVVNYVPPPEVAPEEPVQEIEFVPQEVAIAAADDHRDEVAVEVDIANGRDGSAEQDCIICMRTYQRYELVNPCADNGNVHPVDTHICTDCRRQLHECPICRESYHQRGEDSDSSYDTYSGSVSDSDSDSVYSYYGSDSD
jgi:hypothetical protein